MSRGFSRWHRAPRCPSPRLGWRNSGMGPGASASSPAASASQPSPAAAPRVEGQPGPRALPGAEPHPRARPRPGAHWPQAARSSLVFRSASRSPRAARSLPAANSPGAARSPLPAGSRARSARHGQVERRPWLRRRAREVQPALPSAARPRIAWPRSGAWASPRTDGSRWRRRRNAHPFDLAADWRCARRSTEPGRRRDRWPAR
jgi:hypothetical protein